MDKSGIEGFVGQPALQFSLSGTDGITMPVFVVDLFAGSGGLAEGFAGFRWGGGQQRRFPYRVELSVENDPDANETLRLRAFLRKFKTALPSEYYKHLADTGSKEPNWAELYPGQWSAAERETPLLTLGEVSGNRALERRLEEIRAKSKGWSVLIGGPPCQAFSVVGRIRNASSPGYKKRNDKRFFIYKEFIKALKTLHPAAFVLENVPGLLTSTLDEKPIVDKLLRDLRNAKGTHSYQLYPLSASSTDQVTPSDFVIRTEEHGIPQARKRIIIVGLRREIADSLSKKAAPRLDKCKDKVSAYQVLGSMPRLRSGLKHDDSPVAWKYTVRKARKKIRASLKNLDESKRKKFLSQMYKAIRTLPDAREIKGGIALPDCPSALRDWLFDAKVRNLSHNITRLHRTDDLERYLFASAFGKIFCCSPKTTDFPRALAAKHKNWLSGKFSDRYRVVLADKPTQTITSHISKDGNYYIHPDPGQCRSLTVREAARLQTFPDNYFFKGSRTQQYIQVGNAVPPFLAKQIAETIWKSLEHFRRKTYKRNGHRKGRLSLQA